MRHRLSHSEKQLHDAALRVLACESIVQQVLRHAPEVGVQLQREYEGRAADRANRALFAGWFVRGLGATLGLVAAGPVLAPAWPVVGTGVAAGVAVMGSTAAMWNRGDHRNTRIEREVDRAVDAELERQGLGSMGEALEDDRDRLGLLCAEVIGIGERAASDLRERVGELRGDPSAPAPRGGRFAGAVAYLAPRIATMQPADAALVVAESAMKQGLFKANDLSL